MPYKFLLFKLSGKYEPNMNATSGIITPQVRNKLISDLRSDKAELLYCCEDTSASQFIREDAQASKEFATYFLISLKMPNAKISRRNTRIRAANRAFWAASASCVDTTEKYQVITC